MASGVENESEILLGNKQLLAVFAVVAFLLAIAFTGGYMLGKSSAEKKTAAAEAQAGGDGGTALVPRTVTPDDAMPTPKADTTAPPEAKSAATEEAKPDLSLRPAPPASSASANHPAEAEDVKPPLGSKLPDGSPVAGQTFVQVAALTKAEANAMADVLRKQNFRARTAPKPGSSTIYRVLVGPTRDASEIRATSDALRKIGFRDVIVQRY